ncbi:MAG: ribosome small subunit-dependent GTPase A [Proteobacteria bacterium]|nr:ribosome small subunit-dependent GTPase A [Pseudomonadota bacterium]
MLERFGWSDLLRLQFQSHDAAGLVPARVVVQQRGLYEVVTDQGERAATLAGKFAHDAEEGGYPVTGDWVAVALPAGDGMAQIRAVLPRRSTFIRKAAGPGAPRGQIVAANADLALLVSSLNGDLNLRRIERYLAAAWESGASPVIVLTKADACTDVEACVAEVESVAFGVPVHAISALTGQGLDALRAGLSPGTTAVVLGSSGVGKSTLVNALAGESLMETRAISADGQRGRHTTTHRELILLPSGALILDTPGMRELGLWDAESGVSSAFPEIEALIAQCRFGDCRHRDEPECAVRAARADGSLPDDRWEAWRKLQKELRFEHNKEDWQARMETRRDRVRKHKEGRARMRFKMGEE